MGLSTLMPKTTLFALFRDVPPTQDGYEIQPRFRMKFINQGCVHGFQVG